MIHNIGFCLSGDKELTHAISSLFIMPISKKQKLNLSLFTNDHIGSNIECGIFCYPELWYFKGDLFVFDTNALQFAQNLKQNINIYFGFLGQVVDIVKLNTLLNETVQGICADSCANKRFYRMSRLRGQLISDYIDRKLT